MQESFLDQLLNAMGLSIQVLAALIIASLASAIAYLAKVKNGEPFQLFAFLVNIAIAVLMAFGAAALLRSWTPEVDPNIERVLMVVVGICGNKLIEVIEKYGARYIEKKGKKLSDNVE